jgi:hypothetical protein
MKKIFTLTFIILLTLTTSGQVYTDIKQLMSMGEDIPSQDLLGFGIGNCDLELIKSALAKGADINRQFPLCQAINCASNAILPDEESIIGTQIRDYGSAVFSGRLLSDLRRDYIAIIRFLLQKGAKVNVSSDFSFENIPLIVAAQNRDIEIINLLLDFKADPNSRDNAGYTALHMLGIPESFSYPYKNAPEIAKLLISKGAKMTKISLTGETPLALTKSNLNSIQSNELSHWRDLPFYNELVNSLKSLIEIYSKL